MLERTIPLALALLGVAGLGHWGGALAASIGTSASGAAGAGPHVASRALPDVHAPPPRAIPTHTAVSHDAALARATARLAVTRPPGLRGVADLRPLAVRFPDSAIGRMVFDGEYFGSVSEFARAHVHGAGYHDVVHSAEVSGLAYDLARRRGLSREDALFLSEVGLVHDIDPHRAAGTRARVSATLDLLPDLANRMGWDPRRTDMARALIQRTMFPFEGDEVAAYERFVRALSPSDQRFVLREAPILSEYADKGSNYMLRRFETARRKVIYLAREIDPTGALHPRDLHTAEFLRTLGGPAAFVADREIAARLLGAGAGGLELTRTHLSRIAPDLAHRLETNEGLFRTAFAAPPSAAK